MARCAAPRGAPARLACLVLLALVAAACLLVTASAAPAACPVAANGDTNCEGCSKKSCKFDDNCHFNAVGQAKRGVCQGLVANSLDADLCSGVQRRHGPNAPEEVGGPGKKKARCRDKSVTSGPGFTTVMCECVNKKGNNVNKKGQLVKKCKRCIQSLFIEPETNAPPPPPAPPSPPPPPPGPPPGGFLPNNVMTMQYGAVTYNPTTPNGAWTQLCQVAAQARSVAYGATRPASDGKEYPNHEFLRKLWGGQVPVPNIGTLYNNDQTTYPSDFINKPASYMSGTKYFDSASSWYPSLQQESSASSNSDFLTNYFMSAMQTFTGSSGTPPVPEFSSALSGTSQVSANIQIFEKSSAYFVATTHIMYYLEMAEEALYDEDYDLSDSALDSVAALYFGCGDTNPVPLPVYTPDTVWTTAPQEDTQITWLADPDQEDGDGGTRYSMYGLANKRASNYGNCGPLQTGSCSSSLDAPERSTAGSVTVANLNIIVAEALATATSAVTSYDESSAAIAEIRDAVNTINAQAAQRYIARISLDANNPGNGMGGSTKRAVTVDLPADTTANAVPTACGGGMYVPPGSLPSDTPADATSRDAKLLANNAGTVAAAFDGIGTNVALVAPAEPEDYVARDGTISGTFINAPCGSSASATGTAASNTATMASVMNVITQKSGAPGDKAPYQVQGNDVANSQTDQLASTNAQITAATRGLNEYVEGTDYSKVTPIGCIGPDVYFDLPSATIIDTAGDGSGTDQKMVYTFCNPTGYKGVADVGNTLEENMALYTNGGTAASYAAVMFAAGTKDMATITLTQAGVMREVWDPIMAAQLTDGAFCCNAQYYGADGTGRAQPYYEAGGNAVTGAELPDGTGLISAFVPPLSGGDMSAETSPGTMCPAHSKGDGKDADKVANIGLDNPALTELLEGQAFYAALAPSQYTLPTTSSTTETQAARAAKQKICAEEITAMMKLTKVEASTPDGNVGEATVFDYSYSAVEFPLWKVAIGETSTYTVPNGYCYANACFDDFAKVGMQSTFKGTEKLGELVSGPNMAAVDSAGAACGRANSACAAAPATWTGGPAVMNKLGCTATSCDSAGILATTGAIPVA